MTPRPPAWSAGRYSRTLTDESRLSSSRNSSEPLPLQAPLEQFSCDYSSKRSEEASAREAVSSDSRRAPEAWCSWAHCRPKQPRTGVSRGGHCRANCPTRLPTRWHRRCWTSFRVHRGRLLTSFRQRVRRTRGEKTPGSDSHLAPGSWCSRKATLHVKEPRTGVPRRGHCRPTNVHRGYRLVSTVGFCHFRAQVERILAHFRQRASEERPEARSHGFGLASYSRRLVFPGGDIAGPNSNTAFDPSLE